MLQRQHNQFISNIIPLDIEREIFERAAFLYPEIRLRLLFVARRVHDWIQPILFDAVTLSYRNIDSFLRYPGSLKSAAFFAKHVRTLCIYNCADINSAIRVLSLCSGAVNLACWVLSPDPFPEMKVFRSPNSRMPRPSPYPMPYINSPKLRRLSLCTRSESPGSPFRGISVDMSLFPHLASLTHLEVLDTCMALVQSPLTGFQSLPHLTHLAVNSWGTESELREILQGCQKLRVLILLAGSDMRARSTRDAFGCLDPRMVILPVPFITADWECSIRGERDAWCEAEEMVEARISSMY